MEKETKLERFIEKKLELNENTVNLETNLIDDLHLDSLDRLEMVAELENEFNVSFPDEGLDEIETVKQLLELIESVSAA